MSIISRECFVNSLDPMRGNLDSESLGCWWVAKREAQTGLPSEALINRF